MKTSGSRYVIGIDEAGRGPLAGPVSVGLVLFPPRFSWELLADIRDSKKLTALQREDWYARLCAMGEMDVQHTVMFTSATLIDRKGIVWSIRSAMRRGLESFNVDPDACEVLLDGALKAPSAFLNQTTIIKGDETVPAISLASIAAKVKRDRLMKRVAQKFPSWGFEQHKGYGTPMHREAIAQFGMCDIHRRTFVH